MVTSLQPRDSAWGGGSAGGLRTQPCSEELTASQLHGSQARAAGAFQGLAVLFFIVGIVLLYFFPQVFFKRKQKL